MSRGSSWALLTAIGIGVLGASAAVAAADAPSSGQGVTTAAAWRALPVYHARRPQQGRLRVFGADLNGMLELWEAGLRSLQPGLQFDNRYVSSDAGLAGLVTGVAQVAPQAREPTLLEQQWFRDVRGHAPTAITVATGAYDREGMADGLILFVHRDNPLPGLTLGQLDRIFGAARSGAYEGAYWNARAEQGADALLRTWGQLGLTGDWADKPIQTYGYGPSGMTNFFQLTVMHGSDLWNPNYREYVETGTKMIGDDDRAMRGGLHSMLSVELPADRYGLAIGVLPQAHDIPGIRPLPIAAGPGQPFVAPSEATFRDHSYPLSRSIYIYVDCTPGRPLDPKAYEFLSFVLSRDGQRIVAQADKYLPLTPELLTRERRRLRGCGR